MRKILITLASLIFFAGTCQTTSKVSTHKPGEITTTSGQSCGAMGGSYCSNDGSCPAGTHSVGNSIEPPPNANCTPCCVPGGVPTPCPTTTPTPIPTPTPTPEPPGLCRTERSEVESWRVIVKPHSGQQIDTTPVACGPRVVATNHNCLANCCELSEEKGNQACSDKLYGQPEYKDARGVVLTRTGTAPTHPAMQFVYDDNNSIVKITNSTNCRYTKCPITVTGSKAEASRVYLIVSSTSPACVVPAGSTQGCAKNTPGR